MQDTDFLIVGGGIAGLRAAIALAVAGRVAVLTKADPNESNTGYAQGGIAAAVGDDDSPDLHAADTINAGDGCASRPFMCWSSRPRDVRGSRLGALLADAAPRARTRSGA